MVNFDEPQKSATTMINDLTKQLITLSSGLLTLTVTFSKDLLKIVDHPSLLRFAWIGLVASVVFGFLAMMSITGRVISLGNATPPAVISLGGSLRLFSIVQVIAFLAGLALIFCVGLSALGEAVPPATPK